MEYNVLWIDDLCNDPTGKDFIGYAEQEDINITAFESHEEGITHLMDNLDNYHAVILDAKVKEKQGDTKLGLAGLRASRDKLIQLNEEIYLPWFIFTGQPDYQKSDDFRDSYGNFYIKGDDNEKLLEYIKIEVEKSPDLIIKRDYPEPFKCFGGDYLDIKYERSLLNIISILSDDQIKDAEDLLFNPCRIILERVFEKINEVDEQVLPYALLNFDMQRVGLVNCWKHISGIPYYLNNIRQFPSKFLKDNNYEIVSKQMDVIITACHPASHEIQNKHTQYTFKSVLWALFDVLIWLKKFVDDYK